jgi:hypothetical protein
MMVKNMARPYSATTMEIREKKIRKWEKQQDEMHGKDRGKDTTQYFRIKFRS